MAARSEVIKSPKGRVKRLAQLLRQEITSSRLPADTPVSSVRVLAAKHKVSPLTANRALNVLAKDNIIYRVQGSGTFVAEHDKWLSGRNSRIGINFYVSPARYLNDSYNSAFGLHNSHIIDKLKEEGHEITIISQAESENLEILSNTINSTDALIINKDFIDKNNLDVLLSYSKPVIMIDSPRIKDLPFHQVVPDYFIGFKKVVEYLESLGCKLVVCAGVADTETHTFRRSYFNSIFRQFSNNMILDRDLAVNQKHHDMGRLTGRELGKEFLARNPRPEAIFSVSDFISFGILDVLLEKRLVPGKDFKLISFDNLEAEDLCPFGKPMLTTLGNPRVKQAVEVIKLLNETMACKDSNIRIIKVSADQLIIRKST